MQTRSSNKLESIRSRFSKTVREELSNEIAHDDKVAAVFLIVVNVLFGLYFIFLQTVSASFFTPKFGLFEMVMLFGIFGYWIVTSGLILIGKKHPSRDLDSYGGLFFASFAIGLLTVVFPFDFVHFADALPNTLRFIVQWISNEIAAALLVLLFSIHLIFAVYSLILRLYVRKARAQN